jgi:hypothetical protein
LHINIKNKKMKKLLLSLLILSAINSNGQVLLSEDFNALNVGNVGTDITGATAGQGGWSQFASNGTAPTTSTNMANSNFQIVASGNSSNGLQLEGPNGDKGSRYMWKSGLGTLWTGRTYGNNIIEVEVDINPGAGTTTSRNTFGVYIYNAAGDRILAGFTVRPATRELFIVAYSTPTGQAVGNYSYTLAAAPGIQLPASTFSRIGISYNKTSGQVIIKGPGIAAAGLTLAGSSAGVDPDEVDFISFSGHTTTVVNTSSTTAVMDNFTVKASATDTLLSFDNVNNTVNVSLYPNPATDVLNVSGVENVTSLVINDINGRTIKTVNNITSINVSDLNAGVYFINITTENGNVTKKFMKN